MANRHLARTLTLQSLFEWDFYHGQNQGSQILEHVKKEFAPEFDDQGFSQELLNQVIEHHQAIDQLIVKFAPEWPLDQITTIDRNVLRIGIYELKYDKRIPPKVAINEAIELAKTFGGQASGKFVNGVLGSIYKEMISQGEKQDLQSQGVKEESAGGVVYHRQAEQLQIVLILDSYGKWTLPKGHIEQNETPEQAAVREIGEEVGLKNIRLITRLGETQYKVNRPHEESFRKLVHFFLFETSETKLIAPQTQEIKEAQWFPADEALEKIDYENSKLMLEKALNHLKS